MEAKWILRSDQFGYPIFVGNDFTATDIESDALVFDERDSKHVKESFYSAQAGYPFRAVAVAQ